MPVLKSFDSQIYALLRIVTGFLFLWHGSQKLLGFPGAGPGEVPAFVIYVGGPIELIGGLLVMIGLFTSWAAFTPESSQHCTASCSCSSLRRAPGSGV
jgi:putative oxidoreductase